MNTTAGESIRTTCPYCGVGCGVLAQATPGGVEVCGDPEHPANHGALCSKGSALGETLGLAGRLLAPRVHGVEVDWSTALDATAAGLRRIIEAHGPDAVAFYVSGQLLTEDYYVANKLAKGFIGTANIDTNSRLCMASAVAAHQRAFGEDVVPSGYEDVDQADLVILVGSNLAWCHPVLYRRIVQARERRPAMRLIVIDPRRTPTCDAADLHLPIRAGTDVLLFNGLLAWLAQHEGIDRAFVERHTRGAEAALLAAHNTAGDVGAVARACGVAREALQRCYEWFTANERVVTVFSQGVNQSSAGTDKVNGIINAHLLTGRIGRPGMGPFSITGQPNAMGGREVGGFANTLAAHMPLEDPRQRELVRRFWRAPRVAARAGLKAVDLFEAIHRRQVRAVWIMATNPVVSLPNADRTRAALQRCEWVVVSDCVADTDTAALAHVLLPAAAWGEKDGTVTNSERVISRQRRFLPQPGEARPDWWIICEVARRLGFEEAFRYASAAQIFDEHARLSAEQNAGTRAFDIGGLAGLAPADYECLAPVRWPVRRGAPCMLPAGASAGTPAAAPAAAPTDAPTDAPVEALIEPPRPFADGRFYHPDRRARLIALRPSGPKYAREDEYPLVLNTGRIRDQWHTMTRSGRSARLAAHLPEPFVDMHAADALSFGLKEGGLVRIVTRWGRMVARLRASGEMARGSIFVPIHWSGPNASDARVGALVSPAVDLISGQPEYKLTPARVEPFVVNWYGFALTRRSLQLRELAWWACAESTGCRRYELAGRGVPGSWQRWARALLGTGSAADYLDYEDLSGGTYRAAHLENERLESCLFVSSRPQLPPRWWLASLFEKPRLSAAERTGLLAGRPAGAAGDAPGDAGADAPVCACFAVGRSAIERAIQQGCRSPASIGARLKAGTRCGSCVPELRRLIAQVGANAQQPAAIHQT